MDGDWWVGGMRLGGVRGGTLDGEVGGCVCWMGVMLMMDRMVIMLVVGEIWGRRKCA